MGGRSKYPSPITGGEVREKMPEVTISIVKGTLTTDEKEEMMQRVSEVIAEISCRPDPKENLLPFVYCTIQESEWGNFGTNGAPLTPEMYNAVKKGIVHLTMEQPE
jgi:phenylpyruvate tautomerase PptA (4-oxalocrotonate tautomerase family)